MPGRLAASLAMSSIYQPEKSVVQASRLLLRYQLCRRPIKHQLSLVDDEDTLAQSADLIEVVR